MLIMFYPNLPRVNKSLFGFPKATICLCGCHVYCQTFITFANGFLYEHFLGSA